MLRVRHPILLILIPLLAHRTIAFSIYPIPPGNKAESYHGYLETPPMGDWITSTYCYCQTPDRLDSRINDEGHYFQWEYYNFHHNMTYFMSHTCVANHVENRNCVNNKAPHCDTDPQAECDGNRQCSVWPRSGELFDASKRNGDLPKDYLCMTLDDHNMMGDSDTINWNHQERLLTVKGKQGRQDQPQEVAEELCMEICGQKVSMGLMRGVRSAQSHQELFEHVDDMCDDCK